MWTYMRVQIIHTILKKTIQKRWQKFGKWMTIQHFPIPHHSIPYHSIPGFVCRGGWTSKLVGGGGTDVVVGGGGISMMLNASMQCTRNLPPTPCCFYWDDLGEMSRWIYNTIHQYLRRTPRRKTDFASLCIVLVACIFAYTYLSTHLLQAAVAAAAAVDRPYGVPVLISNHVWSLSSSRNSWVKMGCHLPRALCASEWEGVYIHKSQLKCIHTALTW